MPDEASAIAGSRDPVTTGSLVADLRALGDLDGRVVVVHTSMSRLGWVAGGAQAIVEALLAAVGADGTLVVPTHSTHLSEPSRWIAPPVPETWWEQIRAEMAPFHAAVTPTRQMGAVVECFRHVDGMRRSSHPCYSFAAVGSRAIEITTDHSLDDGMGERSPLARVYDLDGLVLLLGVGHGNDTSLHLAEHRADWPGKQRITQGSPMRVDGQRRWVTYEQLDYDDDGFADIGDALPGQAAGSVGAGTARLVSQRTVVDVGARLISERRADPAP